LTGDLGQQDENGFFTFVARDDDIITSSGYRIGPTEIENCLMKHPSVSLVAVIGLPDPIRTEAVTACIVLAYGAGSDQLADSLKQFVREMLSAHLVPRQIIWRKDLPLTATGKIRRKALRESLLPETNSSLD
jgi:acetyl-CoA synthetase